MTFVLRYRLYQNARTSLTVEEGAGEAVVGAAASEAAGAGAGGSTAGAVGADSVAEEAFVAGHRITPLRTKHFLQLVSSLYFQKNSFFILLSLQNM